MKVYIYSRKAIEELLQSGFPENTAVISFYDPPSKRTGEVFKPVDYKGKAERVFTIPIYDIDIEILEDYGLTFDTYFPEVNSLAEYIHQAYKDGLDIICQCEYGQSRSAACAAAILQYYYNDGISVFADYRYYPNQLVYNKIKNALDKGVTAMNKITSFRDEYRFLSNFYQCPFEYRGLTYPNAEAAFQAQKCSNDEDKIKYTLQKNPVRVKQMGKKEPNLPANWDTISYDIMNEILHAKFSVPELAEKLIATGNAHLEEGNHWHDNRWGKCTCEKCSTKEGQNWLGKILMNIRDELNTK